jgi:hypothetical protein
MRKEIDKARVANVRAAITFALEQRGSLEFRQELLGPITSPYFLNGVSLSKDKLAELDITFKEADEIVHRPVNASKKGFLNWVFGKAQDSFFWSDLLVQHHVMDPMAKKMSQLTPEQKKMDSTVALKWPGLPNPKKRSGKGFFSAAYDAGKRFFYNYSQVYVKPALLFHALSYIGHTPARNAYKEVDHQADPLGAQMRAALLAEYQLALSRKFLDEPAESLESFHRALKEKNYSDKPSENSPLALFFRAGGASRSGDDTVAGLEWSGYSANPLKWRLRDEWVARAEETNAERIKRLGNFGGWLFAKQEPLTPSKSVVVKPDVEKSLFRRSADRWTKMGKWLRGFALWTLLAGGAYTAVSQGPEILPAPDPHSNSTGHEKASKYFSGYKFTEMKEGTIAPFFASYAYPIYSGHVVANKELKYPLPDRILHAFTLETHTKHRIGDRKVTAQVLIPKIGGVRPYEVLLWDDEKIIPDYFKYDSILERLGGDLEINTHETKVPSRIQIRFMQDEGSIPTLMVNKEKARTLNEELASGGFSKLAAALDVAINKSTPLSVEELAEIFRKSNFRLGRSRDKSWGDFVGITEQPPDWVENRKNIFWTPDDFFRNDIKDFYFLTKDGSADFTDREASLFLSNYLNKTMENSDDYIARVVSLVMRQGDFLPLPDANWEKVGVAVSEREPKKKGGAQQKILLASPEDTRPPVIPEKKKEKPPSSFPVERWVDPKEIRPALKHVWRGEPPNPEESLEPEAHEERLRLLAEAERTVHGNLFVKTLFKRKDIAPTLYVTPLLELGTALEDYSSGKISVLELKEKARNLFPTFLTKEDGKKRPLRDFLKHLSTELNDWFKKIRASAASRPEPKYRSLNNPALWKPLEDLADFYASTNWKPAKKASPPTHELCHWTYTRIIGGHENGKWERRGD